MILAKFAQQIPDQMHTGNKYNVVVIGASAGGLSLLISILEKLPADYPLAVLIVQHRMKEAHSELLEEVLQARCMMTVKQADEKEKIYGGMVYVAPPDYHLLVERDPTFSLSADEPVHYSRPSIDVLFESVARVYGGSAIGIILTGANSDGASGIGYIYRSGGMTIAQDPGEAEFRAMPLAAIGTGDVVHTWPLAAIEGFLVGLYTDDES
jgi:two-component system chemotaxis response regulator CheB